MQCEREISKFQAQPRAVFQRMRGKAAKGIVPTEIRVLIVRLRRDIGPRGPPEPLYRVMSLQAGPPPSAMGNAPERGPIPGPPDPPPPNPPPFSLPPPPPLH